MEDLRVEELGMDVIECIHMVDVRRVSLGGANKRKARAKMHIRSRRIERLIDRKTGLAAQEGTNRMGVPMGFSSTSIWEIWEDRSAGHV